MNVSKMKLTEQLDVFSSEPRKLFLFDGLGALLSAFLLGVVLVKFKDFFGIPTQTLYFLAFLPCVFAVYDFYCFARVKKNQGFFLEVIAYINTIYCFLSLGLAFYHKEELTVWGWTYILLEIAIVLALAYIELVVAKKIKAGVN